MTRKRKPLSPQTKHKISLALRGVKNPNFGKPLSAQHRENIKRGMIELWQKRRA